MKSKSKPNKTPRMNLMSDEELENVLRHIMEERDAGSPYEHILLSLEGVWLSSGIPKTSKALRSFIQSANDSKRSPQWYKQWYAANVARPARWWAGPDSFL